MRQHDNDFDPLRDEFNQLEEGLRARSIEPETQAMSTDEWIWSLLASRVRGSLRKRGYADGRLGIGCVVEETREPTSAKLFEVSLNSTDRDE